MHSSMKRFEPAVIQGQRWEKSDAAGSRASSNGAVNAALRGGIVTTAVSSDDNWPNACAVDHPDRLVSAGRYRYTWDKEAHWGLWPERWFLST